MNSAMMQPALIGGLVMGVLSALPIISAGNICCCLWVVSGGIVAAYVLQQNQPTAITIGDGALVGLLAGITGAFVSLLLSIPIQLIVAPMQRQVLERLIDAGDMPPEFREYAAAYVGGITGILISFITTLFAGLVFSTLGGVIGAAIFRRPPDTSTTVLPPSPPYTPSGPAVPPPPM
jgi:hypothetical protein